MTSRWAARVLPLALIWGCGGSNKPRPEAPPPATPPVTSEPTELSPREIVERYKPAIVRIENNFGVKHVVGTGFIVDPQGRIATNLHVIAGGGRLTVKLADGSEHEVIQVVAFDPVRDLALIEIEPASPLPTVPLGDSENVSSGDSVVAIGNPLAYDYTVSDGLISSVRPVDEIGTLLQISAPISQGSSGGPLFNASGQVIGVATFLRPDGQNLNFGVPINYLRPLLQKVKGETVAEFAKRFEVQEGPSEIRTDKGTIKRDIPDHKIALLKMCSPEQALKVYQRIERTIELGAPLYNEGDHEACFNIYEQTAQHFKKDAGMCKGIREAFTAGLERAGKLSDPTAKAWAMRDTFDGLLRVIAKKAQANPDFFQPTR